MAAGHSWYMCHPPAVCRLHCWSWVEALWCRRSERWVYGWGETEASAASTPAAASLTPHAKNINVHETTLSKLLSCMIIILVGMWYINRNLETSTLKLCETNILIYDISWKYHQRMTNDYGDFHVLLMTRLSIASVWTDTLKCTITSLNDTTGIISPTVCYR